MKEKAKKNKRGAIIATVIAAILLAILYLHPSTNHTTISTHLDSTFNVVRVSVTYTNHTALMPPYVVSYYAYIAQNLAQQEEGYMNQTSLGDCNGHYPCIGMLFQFQNTSYYCFWMENTEIPLTQIWLASNGTVVYVAKAQPYSTQNICHMGLAVLETSINSSISTGDSVRLENSTYP